MRHLACSSGAQFEDLPPSAVEESPGTPARLRSLRPLINSSGLVRYSILIEDPSLLLHNVAVVQDYAELDWGSKENSARNIAFYCNAYNIWAMYLAFKKMRKHGLAWKGQTTIKSRTKFFYFTSITVAGQKTTLLKLEKHIYDKFHDPRVCFAINSASWSSPRLPKELYDANQLQAQLDERADSFINRQGGCVFEKDDTVASVSSVFKWSKASFAREGGIAAFVNQYKQGQQLPEGVSIEFQAFDWSVNWENNARANMQYPHSPSRKSLE
ncbi:hypothetical protein ABBQ32_006847 [Trebouxia sp. C0010 RCD-2024]